MRLVSYWISTQLKKFLRWSGFVFASVSSISSQISVWTKLFWKFGFSNEKKKSWSALQWNFRSGIWIMIYKIFQTDNKGQTFIYKWLFLSQQVTTQVYPPHVMIFWHFLNYFRFSQRSCFINSNFHVVHMHSFHHVSRWGTHLYKSHFSSVRHAPYLRNRTSSNHNFWYNCVKW